MFAKKRIYLDHAAATPVSSAVIRAMSPYWSDFFGNPSAIHQEGVTAKKVISGVRDAIAGLLRVHSDEIIFTGSATESANLAIRGVVDAYQKEHKEAVPRVIISSLEHAAVLETAHALRAQGVDVVDVPILPSGVIDMDALAQLINEHTVLVSVMLANNEIGVIQPIREIAKLLREKRKSFSNARKEQVAYPYFHTDACQATNYIDLDIPKLGVDLLTVNSAKIYGPKGIALLYVRRGVKIAPIIQGGGQEFGLRAGTEQVSLIVGFGAAMKGATMMREKESLRVRTLRDEMLKQIRVHYPEVVVNGDLESRLPNNLNLTFPGVDHEFLVLVLDANGVAVSTKSACNEFDAEISHVLLALRGEHDDLPPQGVRITLGRDTTLRDVARVASIFGSIRQQILPLL